MRCYRSGWWLLLLTLLAFSCRPAGAATNSIAVANTYLESAARDLLGDSVTIVRLAEPGMCPGHFDLRPSQITDLQSCPLLLRFEFQKSLDEIIHSGNGHEPTAVAVAVPGGLCRPASYRGACRQVAEALVTGGWLLRTMADDRVRQIGNRLEKQSVLEKQQIAQAGLVGTPVIASGHQRDFCEWLGLKVVATFRAADVSSVAEIDEAIHAGQLAGVKLVIANLPEGRRTADALAERLGARVAVFGNFPELSNGRVSFDELLQGNVAALFRAHKP